MGGSRSDRERAAWKRRQKESEGKSVDAKREAWWQAKSENEQVHAHFMATCCACGQTFMICGLPCFVICPTCQTVLTVRFE